MINNKLRSRISVAADASEEKIREAVLADDKANTWIGEKDVKKIIIVPKRLVNIIV